MVRHPDILILEGLNVLQTGPTLMVSDLFDFSLYVDARIEDIEQWYVSRFLAMRTTAFADPESHFHHYAAFSDSQAVVAAREIWRTINRPNLVENILPTRPRATLVLRKDADHSINRLRLREAVIGGPIAGCRRVRPPAGALPDIAIPRKPWCTRLGPA